MMTQENMSRSSTRLHLLRMTRKEDQALNHYDLCDQQIHDLAAKHIGIFSGGFTSCNPMMRKISELSKIREAGKWVVAFSSRAFAETAVDLLGEHGVRAVRDGKAFRWHAGDLELVTIEGLARLSASDRSGVIMIDPRCHIHKSRDFRIHPGRVHDRPQVVVDFLARTTNTGNPAILSLWTLSDPLSLPVTRIAEIYARAAWWFAEPNSIRFWDENGTD